MGSKTNNCFRLKKLVTPNKKMNSINTFKLNGINKNFKLSPSGKMITNKAFTNILRINNHILAPRISTTLSLYLAVFDAHLLQFTMDSGKFYIGWVKELPKPFTTSYIRITPAFSGYRRTDDKELVFTTQYLTVYASYIEDGSVANTEELKTDLVLKADKINSVSFFDMDMYNRFNPAQEETS